MTVDVDTPAIEAGLAFARRWLERHDDEESRGAGMEPLSDLPPRAIVLTRGRPPAWAVRLTERVLTQAHDGSPLVLAWRRTRRPGSSARCHDWSEVSAFGDLSRVAPRRIAVDAGTDRAGSERALRDALRDAGVLEEEAS